MLNNSSCEFSDLSGAPPDALQCIQMLRLRHDCSKQHLKYQDYHVLINMLMWTVKAALRII